MSQFTPGDPDDYIETDATPTESVEFARSSPFDRDSLAKTDLSVWQEPGTYEWLYHCSESKEMH